MKPILISFLLFALAGCSADIDSSMTEYGFGSLVRITCSDAEFQGKQYNRFFRDLPLSEREDIEDRMEVAKKKCQALESVLEIVQPTHEKLKSGYLTPHTKYAFNIVESPEFYRPVGFFGVLEDCRDARQRLSAVGYEVEKCYKRTLFWKTAWA